VTAVPLIRFLTIFALLLAPIGMARLHSAQAMSGDVSIAASEDAAPKGHCAGMSGELPDQPQTDLDCTIACSAVPVVAGAIPAPAPVLAMDQPLPREEAQRGLTLGFDPPPPRAS
jgi:hypothetical protein